MPIVEAVIAMYPVYKDENATTTDVRDDFVNDIVQYIGVNMHWPWCGDSPEYEDKFDALLNEACAKFGIKISE